MKNFPKGIRKQISETKIFGKKVLRKKFYEKNFYQHWLKSEENEIFLLH